jgi:peptide/nickel transport system permease protein
MSYWKFALRRVLYGVAMYAFLVLLFAVIFNAQMEKTQQSQIREQLNAERLSLTQKRVSPEELKQLMAAREQRLRDKYRLDEPVVSRIVKATMDTLFFRFGDSTIIRSQGGERDVWTILSEKIPRTVMLFTVAILLDIILGILLGLRNARKAGGAIDRATSITTMVVFGLPTWWLAMILIMFLAFKIPIFPSGGLHTVPPPGGVGYTLDLLYHLALPVLTLVVLGFWGRAYLTRNIVLGTLQEDFIMSARARGLSERKILLGHTLRAAAPPIVTMSLLSLLGSFGGALIFEGIFSWPGMGNLYWVAIQQNDIPVLMANLSVTTLIYVGGLVLLDLVYGFLDPRIKVSGKA